MRPAGPTFVNGLAKQYETYFPPELEGQISLKNWQEVIEQINETLFVYMPCDMCWYSGYIFCLFTLGLSLCLTSICVKEAGDELHEVLEEVNRVHFKRINRRIRLVKECSTSWLEISKLTMSKDDSESLI